MDQQTLEYLVSNTTEFIVGIALGTGLGYLSSRSRSEDRLVDTPEMTKIGYATLITLLNNPIAIGLTNLGFGTNENLMKAAQGDMGNVLGLYAGFCLGKAIDRGLSYLDTSRNMHNNKSSPTVL